MDSSVTRLVMPPVTRPLTRVFVYGTLKPGERNFDGYCANRLVAVDRAIARGFLYDLPLGYPAMILGMGWVQGAVLSFPDDSILQSLDELECFVPDGDPQMNEYERRAIAIFDPQHCPLGQAWVYVMDRLKVQQLGGRWLPDGWWTSGVGL